MKFPKDDKTALIKLGEELPKTLIIVPLKNPILIPGMALPLILTPGKISETIEFAESQTSYVGFVPPIREKDQEFKREDLHPFGVAAKIIKVIKLLDGTKSAAVICLKRIKIIRYFREEPYLIAKVEYPPDIYSETKEFFSLVEALKDTLKEYIKYGGVEHDPAFNIAVTNIEDPALLTDFIGGQLDLNQEDKLFLLSTIEVQQRLARVIKALIEEVERRKVSEKIRSEIRKKVEKVQKEFFLREQLKAIRKELGEEVDQRVLEIEEFKAKIEKGGLPKEAQNKAEEELKRLEVLPPEAPEYNIIRGYLKWLVELPWSKATKDRVDLKFAEKVLNADHYGLEEIKARIIEYLAVRQLKPDQKGAILCFAGPPGVGKTSLGQSIARALGRRFFRFSLGGMRDEAEIKGHRRTYIGAMPGKILQGLHRVGVNNPVFMLDEIDKLGKDWRGDPSSAMLEVLDPEQNHSFLDHYIDVSFDLSQVMFICTANIKHEIPAPLLDRMEVLELPGYILDEKVQIGSKYLIPRQRKAHGLNSRHLQILPSVLPKIIEEYTKEAGIRELERNIARICRKVAAKIVKGESQGEKITTRNLEEYLGPRRYFQETIKRTLIPGVAVGLAWTPYGGDILFIEATRMKGKESLRLTGKLGEIMNESAQIALSYVRSHASDFNIDTQIFEESLLHIHFPAGAVPKDGPSAGVTIAAALISLLKDKKGRRLNPKIAMTGELTLRGQVLPVGGIREKIIAAKRGGIKTIILPKENERDTKEIPPSTIKGLKFVFVERFEEIYETIFPET